MIPSSCNRLTGLRILSINDAFTFGTQFLIVSKDQDGLSKRGNFFNNIVGTCTNVHLKVAK